MYLELRFPCQFNMESCLFPSLRQWPQKIKTKTYIAAVVILQLVNPDLIECEENIAELFQNFI